ncbi:MAG TPA: metal-sensitive transcriptional regulator [Dehalococcoidia bacterium]|nr:metal-sensitive transcriptional regulator [Dehalococcoidia bacterium]
MEEGQRQEALRRLSYIEGHLCGIRKMMEENRYCVDVLRQTLAVRKAIERLEALILANHLHTCVPLGIKDGKEDKVISELLELFNVAEK